MKKVISILIVSFLITQAQAQITLSDVTMPKKVKIGASDLTLKGAGIREKLWLDLYVAGLYVTSTSKTASSIINADEPTSIKIHIVSSLITSKKMITAVNEGFEKSTNKNTDPIKKEIDLFKQAFMEDIKTDDVFDIFYVPNKGTFVIKNGKLAGKIGGGIAFKKALFGIWIGENPADEGLKDDLLGK